MQPEGYSFRFNANACGACEGKCCIGSSGFIWVNPREKRMLADSFGLSIEEFSKKYVDRLGQRDSLKEIHVGPNNYACIFFDLDQKKCTVYDLRPVQCRTFPFWPYYKKHPKKVAQECPGIQLSNSD